MEGTSSPLVLKLGHGADLTAADHEVLEGFCHGGQRIGVRQDLIQEGADPRFVHIVLEGIACRYKMLPDGSRQIMALLLPGDFCDLHVAILGTMDHSIGTLSPCCIARLGRSTVEDLAFSHPRIMRAMWWATLVDEAILREWIVGMGRRPADRRLAHLFCELLVRLQTVGLALEAHYDLPLAQYDLADILGLTPVHVNRMLQQLRTDSLITLTGKRLTIPDVPRLKDFADFDPNYLHLQLRAPRHQGEGEVRLAK